MIKRFLFFLLAVLIFQDRPLVFGDGELDLPSVYVWGEDRSDIPGVETEDVFVFPHLRKSDFLQPLSLKLPQRQRPFKFFEGGAGLRLIAGAGNYDEYFLRVINKLDSRDGWFYTCDVSGTRQRIDSKGDHRSVVKGVLEAGENRRFYRWSAKARGQTEDFHLSRELLNLGGDISWQPGRFDMSAGGGYTRVGVESYDSNEVRLSGSARYSPFYGNRLSLEFSSGRLQYDEESRQWVRPDLKYTNTALRNLSFSARMGYRDGLLWQASVSGEVLPAGWKIYARRDIKDRELYGIYENKNTLKPVSMPEAQKEDVYGVRIAGDLPGGISAYTDLNYAVVENPLTIVKSGEYGQLFNMSEERDILSLKARAEKGFFSCGAKLRNAGKEMPYIYNKFYAGFSPAFNIAGRRVKINTRANYFSEHEAWLDKQGNESQDIEPYVSLDIELSVHLNSYFDITIGGENLLNEDILPQGRYGMSDPRYYILVGIGYRQLK